MRIQAKLSNVMTQYRGAKISYYREELGGVGSLLIARRQLGCKNERASTRGAACPAISTNGSVPSRVRVCGRAGIGQSNKDDVIGLLPAGIFVDN